MLKFHYIQDTIDEQLAGYWKNREEMILSWIRIGRTHITHSHHLKKEDILICFMCKVYLTVKHILLNCDNITRQATKRHFSKALN